MSATQDLKEDHIIVRRLGSIAPKCSNKLSANEPIPLEDIKIISAIIEEFVDSFHHGKEEKVYIPETENRDNFAEDIHKFLIEHDLGRRIARMLSRHLDLWQKGTDSREPVARFLQSYAIFIADHTGKEDKFFDLVEENGILSNEENAMLIQHYESCHKQSGGKIRIEQMIKLIDYLENRDWIK